MKLDKKKALIIWIIAFALFNLVTFLVPLLRFPSFWIAYFFTVVAFVLQIPIWRSTILKADTNHENYLSIPQLSIASRYLKVQLIIYAVLVVLTQFMPLLPMWIPTLVCIIWLGICAIRFFAVGMGTDAITAIDKKVAAKTLFIQGLKLEADLLIQQTEDAELKAALGKLAETVRFSDPMSNDALATLESNIAAKFTELKTAVTAADAAAAKQNIVALNLLLQERNAKCKMLKHN